MTTQGHARQFMTTPVETVALSTTLEEVARLLAVSRTGAVIVLGETSQAVGIVSEVDVMREWLMTGSLRSSAGMLMSTPVKSVNEFDTTDAVIRLFRENRIHHLPVLREGRVIGLITPGDVLRFLSEHILPKPEQSA